MTDITITFRMPAAEEEDKTNVRNTIWVILTTAVGFCMMTETFPVFRDFAVSLALSEPDPNPELSQWFRKMEPTILAQIFNAMPDE
jgi:hypothetical protein